MLRSTGKVSVVWATGRDATRQASAVRTQIPLIATAEHRDANRPWTRCYLLATSCVSVVLSLPDVQHARIGLVVGLVPLLARVRLIGVDLPRPQAAIALLGIRFLPVNGQPAFAHEFSQQHSGG